MESKSLEVLVGKPVASSGMITLNSPQTHPKNTSIDGVFAENPQSTRLGNETTYNRLAGLYERGRRAVSQIKSRVSRGARRAVFVTTLAGALAACATAGLYTHTNSSGVKVVYPPDFSCGKISIDYGVTIPITTQGGTIYIPHPGIDIQGNIVIAAADGVVRAINYRIGSGNFGPGYQISLRHTPQDLGVAETYSITWYSHLKKIDGENSALKYVQVGQRVKKGQPIGEVGSSGTTYEHLHFTPYVKQNAWPIDDLGSDLSNPHDFWGLHPLDKPREVKYIPFLSEGEKYEGPKSGFIYPILCPPRRKVSLNLDYKNPLIGLDLDTLREKIIEKIKSRPHSSQLKKAA